MQTVETALDKLEKSAFRSRFHLGEKERAYIAEKGLDTVREHARDFIKERLAPANPKNDGAQTPMRGHPVFIAQHATACCCRNCLYKWYKVEKGVEISENDREKIVSLIMAWIERDLKRPQKLDNGKKK